ncbi:hypothetical protein [Brachyspira sp.]|uniref:hypothetical protein n=1 Tax=Brachyspira sp. TaxID=1977261 RepID=UPI002639956F|nr:hypothetical protein [Brachyspira sp.]
MIHARILVFIIEHNDYSDEAILILSEIFITYNLKDNDYNETKKSNIKRGKII